MQFNVPFPSAIKIYGFIVSEAEFTTDAAYKLLTTGHYDTPWKLEYRQVVEYRKDYTPAQKDEAIALSQDFMRRYSTSKLDIPNKLPIITSLPAGWEFVGESRIAGIRSVSYINAHRPHEIYRVSLIKDCMKSDVHVIGRKKNDADIILEREAFYGVDAMKDAISYAIGFMRNYEYFG